jgi:hypothetical protein
MAPLSTLQSTQSATQQAGVNQIMELFKMQYLMKFIESSSGSKSFLTMCLLLGYDQFVKYIPYLIQLLNIWFTAIFYPINSKDQLNQEPFLLQTVQPPATKTMKAFIQFERATEGKLADLRIDAVLYHVCNLPEVRSLRYNGVEMIPNFKDSLLIETDIWFELLTQYTNQQPPPSTSNTTLKQESIVYRLSTYDHDILWLHRFVEQAMEAFEQEKRNKLGSEQYYFDMIGSSSQNRSATQGTVSFTKSKFVSNRSLQNVYIKQIDDLQKRVDFFLKRRDWYDTKGIPHTLGIVMYGVPGCGKTSTIKAIANETKRHIFNLLLSEIKTKDALKELFYNDQVAVVIDGKLEILNIPLKQRLYVIEDIDAMNSIVLKRSPEQLKQEQEHKLKVEAEMELLKQTQGELMARNMMKGKEDATTDKLDLATLLNVLDGVRETPGRIIVLSTNYPERLDEALLRPGRFDMMLEFEKHSCSVLKQHLEKHYDTTLTVKQDALIMRPSLEKKWTPAEVSQILFRRIGDLDGAIQDLYVEDPALLFRFSCLQNQEKEQSTNLEDLLKSEEQETQKTQEIQETHELPVEVADIESVVPTAEEVFKDCSFQTSSILFGIHADMGLLSANDTGLPTLKQFSIPEIDIHYDLPQDQLGFLPADQFGLAAANEGEEPSLDDFFPSLD